MMPLWGVGNENTSCNENVNASYVSDKPENVMHETCNKNLSASHVLETVPETNVNIKNGPSKKAQLLSKPNQCGLGEKDPNNGCSGLGTEMRLKPIEQRSVAVEQLKRRIETMGLGKEKGTCVACSNGVMIGLVIEELWKDKVIEEVACNNEPRKNKCKCCVNQISSGMMRTTIAVKRK